MPLVHWFNMLMDLEVHVQLMSLRGGEGGETSHDVEVTRG